MCDTNLLQNSIDNHREVDLRGCGDIAYWVNGPSIAIFFGDPGEYGSDPIPGPCQLSENRG